MPLLRIQSELEELERVREALRGYYKTYFDSVDLNRIILSVDEAIANIIEHSDATHIEIEYDARDKSVHVVIRDSGAPFDPTAAPLPDPGDSQDTEADGGLGLFLFRTLMQASYSRNGNSNELVLRRSIPEVTT